MTAIVSWNIQYGKGVDGVIDLRRVVARAKESGPIDVLCLQEVAVNFAEMGGGADVDQVAELAALLPGYAPVFAAPVDHAGPHGRRHRFGNMILSRLPVLEATVHALPRPAEPGVQHMPRGVAAALVETPHGPLRIMTTHLEFHSERQRAAQVDRLRAIYQEAVANEHEPPSPGRGPYRSPPAASGTIICGDFNFEPTDSSYCAMGTPFPNGVEPLLDAWTARYPSLAHAPTCGIHDREQWAQGPHARDFFFVSASLARHVRAVTVDVDTPFSDHQPIRIEFAA
jgi:endonuclease/exonuclease/phosphatase family metal-dependent hydrolase